MSAGEITGDGDCFERAVHVVMEMGARARDARVVHGVCVGRNQIVGRRYVHAWVEVGEMVLDFSNGLSVVMPRARYYQLGQVSETRKYTRFMVREQMFAFQHYGPWEKFNTDATIKSQSETQA